MGTRTFVRPIQASSPRKAQSGSRISYGQIDVPLALAIIALCVFGLIMVYSASWDFSQAVYNSSTHIFYRQILWMGLGVSLIFGLNLLDYHKYRDLVVGLLAVTIALLVAVLIVNEVRLGAVRTFFQGSIQPSELAKLVVVLYLSVWLYAKRETLQDVGLGLAPLAVILGVLGGLIYRQPDLSAAATVFILGGLLFFLAGGDLKQIILLMVIAVVVSWLIVQVNATGRARLTSYMAGLHDPLQSSYHVRRSLEAVVRGGWFGVGIGNSTTKLTGLPVPPTDSIFAVISEELGFLGAAGLIGLYAVIFWRGLRIAQKAPDMLGTLLAAGLTFWIALEAIINMAVMVGLFPFAGNTLPFVSAGGSNLTASMAAIGILMNIARQGNARQQSSVVNPAERRDFLATLNLRRRDGRRSISRPRRP
jgi:cell division protein FtsW